MTEAVLRAIESKGQMYVHGYAARFDTPDAHGTIMTRQFIEDNIARLRKFPAVRFQHNPEKPFGQIMFDEEIDGITTFLDDTGFYVLIRAYDSCRPEWKMVQQGHWGLSYGIRPERRGRKCLTNDQCFETFETGILYEISVVDSPSHPNTEAQTIERSVYNLGEIWQEKYPKICSPACENRTCPYYRVENFERPCFFRSEAVKVNP
jgi:phage head maturation protease